MQIAHNQFLSQLNSHLITNFGHNEKQLAQTSSMVTKWLSLPAWLLYMFHQFLQQNMRAQHQRSAKKGLPNKALSQLYPVFHLHIQSINFSKYIPLHTSCLLHICYSFMISPIQCPEFHYHKNHGRLALIMKIMSQVRQSLSHLLSTYFP